jgi:hypothetical protein
MDHGLGLYLEHAAEAQRRVPEVLVVPGVEVAPHYWWTGTPWDALTLHGFDRHLWVAGLSEEDARHLPVVGNETVRNTRLSWSRIAVPVSVLALALMLLAFRRDRSDRREARYRRAGWFALAIAAALMWNNWPFGDLSRPDRGSDDISAYQRLIDYVGEHDGVSYWSYPEATVPDIRLGGARMVSGPHAEDLLLTDGYDGMEGLYGDAIRATAPGGLWDRALQDYLRGDRRRPPFVVTGINFHGPELEGDGWSRLDAGTTFLLLSEKTERGVVEALRGGHAYATFMGLPEKFALDRFVVETADGVAGTHGDHISGPSPIAVHLSLDWTGGVPDPPPIFDLEIIRNGRVEASVRQSLPLDTTVELELPPGRHYVRIQAEGGRLNRVLGNPVFIDVP